MKPYQRRDENKYPYYKLAVWDARSMTWRDGKRAYPSLLSVRMVGQATGPGKYRVSEITADGRHDIEPFVVT